MEPFERDGPLARVGPYRLVRRIGAGGMAEVFEAEQEQLGQRVALKRLHRNVADRPDASARFLREGRAIARVRHPNVVQVFALGEHEGAPYLAMELLEGEDLGARLEREQRLGVRGALDVFLPVLAGMTVAHEAGVIHRDLKPSNIFLTLGTGGTSLPKVIDFGISKLLESDAPCMTDSEFVLGTVAYMAPEQARGARNVSFQSDQYSLGVLLYECLTGTRPFRGESVVETLQAIMTAPVVQPSAVNSEVSAALDAVVLRAMDRDAAERFPSLASLGAALIPFASATSASVWRAWFEERCVGLVSRDESRSAFARSAPPAGATTSTQLFTQTPGAAPTGRSRIVRVALAFVATLLVLGAVLLASARQRALATTAPAASGNSELLATETARQGSLATTDEGSLATTRSSVLEAPPVPSARPGPGSASSASAGVPSRRAHVIHEPSPPRAIGAAPSSAPSAISVGSNDAPILP